MSDPDDLAAFLDLGWACLQAAKADRDAPARHPTLATVSPDGLPEARTVVLRAIDRAANQFEVHTDPASAKVAALNAQPKAQLHIWDPQPRLQLRLSVRVKVVTGADAAERWAKVPESSRAAYGKTPAVGTPIDRPYAFEVTGAAADFAVLGCRIDQIDLLELADRHRRAIYRFQDAWQGCWVAP